LFAKQKELTPKNPAPPHRTTLPYKVDGIGRIGGFSRLTRTRAGTGGGGG